VNSVKDPWMRRSSSISPLALAAMLLAAASPALPAGAQPPQPPHAWLFGTWTGGLFPVPEKLSAEACLSQPVVIFTRDLVMRATLINQTLTQRVVETANVTPGGVEFRFAPGGVVAGSDTFGMPNPATAGGFGCDSENALHVQRKGPNEIAFPGCKDFPNPLVRCPSR
jgi:hypothetical protein